MFNSPYNSRTNNNLTRYFKRKTKKRKNKKINSPIIDDILKVDDHILSIVSRVQKMSGWMDRNVISSELNVLKISPSNHAESTKSLDSLHLSLSSVTSGRPSRLASGVRTEQMNVSLCLSAITCVSM